jgi:molecular chaperone DnaK
MSTSPILGIDLGTTHSLVGVVDCGLPILLADEDNHRLLPSALFVDKDGQLSVGRAALHRRELEPLRLITSAKRLLGRRPGESDWQPPYDLRALGQSPVSVAAAILRRLREIAEFRLGQPLSRAVITVPAYFNDAQRNATKQAAKQAGLEVERILSEPTAAALAYGLNRAQGESRIAVYDLGGGTFDISILRLRDGVFEVLSTAGDTQLGGDDMDRLLAQRLNPQQPDCPRLIAAAESAKRTLSTQEQARIEIPFYRGAEHLQAEINRAEFERMIAPLLERSRTHCLRALGDAGLKAAELDAVILVGGCTRIPAVQRLVAEVFGRPPDMSQHPDEAVAMGAVIQAGILEGSLRQVLLLDVTPLSLGIETYGGLMNVLIPRNSTLPCKAGEMFTNAVANQGEMLIRVLQGEREMAADNWELGRVLVPLPAGARGSARVGVQFSLDANGILEVLARDTHSGEDRILQIENSAVDVSDERVEAMIQSSVDHAFEDMHQRQWTQATMKSRELLEGLDAALSELGPALSAEQAAPIHAAAAQLRRLLEQQAQDLQALKQANQRLDEVTQELAVMLVERALEQAGDLP